MGKVVTITLGLLLLASGSVCAQGVVLPLPPEDQQNITAQFGPNVVGAALPSQPIADPSLYFPRWNGDDRSDRLQDRSRTAVRSCGPDAGNIVTHSAEV